VLVDKPAVTGVQLDAVADQLRADNVLLLVNDVPGAGQKVSGRDVFLDAVTRPVQLALSHASQVDHRLAQCLRWDRPGVGTHTAKHLAMFDHRHRFTELGCGDRRLLSAGARTDDDEVVLAYGRVHMPPLLLNDAALRTRLLWDSPRSARLSKIADHFQRADRAFPAGYDQRDSTCLRHSRTHPCDYYQLVMPRMLEQC
jgi:hypothetical protein